MLDICLNLKRLYINYNILLLLFTLNILTTGCCSQNDLDSSGIDYYATITLGKNEETDILATTQNYILKRDINNTLLLSSNLGQSWLQISDRLEDVTFVHWFKDGTCLIADKLKCYTTKISNKLTESTVYDFDGSIFKPNSSHFYALGNNNYEYHELKGKECVLWNDYNAGVDEYESRVWISTDQGKTVHCILKSGETIDTNNKLISVRHFHHLYYDDKTETIWVTSGDFNEQCSLIKGHYNDITEKWEWTIVGQGNAFKFDQVWLDENNLYFVTDYTFYDLPTGIIRCDTAAISSDNFEYLYKVKENYPQKNQPYPVTFLFCDSNGNKCLLPDGIGYNIMWYAKNSWDFKPVKINSDEQLSFTRIYGPNFNGDCIIQGCKGYESATNPAITSFKFFLFTKAMRDAGFSDFCK